MSTSFGQTLKKYRETTRPRLSQSKLAERAGFDHSYVSRLESGARTPKKEAVEALHGALGLNYEVRSQALRELLSAAGFLPINAIVLPFEEEELCKALAFLEDFSIPEPNKETLRELIRLSVKHATLLLTKERDRVA